MAILFSDVPFWSDVLTKTGMKPWFEKLSTFFVAMILVSCFFVLYGIRIAGSVYCLPEGKFTHNLTTQDVNYINAVCFNEWQSPLQYADLVAFAFFALIFMCRSSWLLSSQVTKSFTSVVDLDKMLRKLNVTPAQLIKKTAGPSDDNEKVRVAVREIRACLLTSEKTSWPIARSIPCIYIFRNCLVILSTGACMFISWMFFIPLAKEETEFTCKPGALSSTAYTTFQCTHHLSMILYVHLIVICIYAGILGVIAFFCVCYLPPGSQCDSCGCNIHLGLSNLTHENQPPTPTDQFCRAMYNTLFLNIFNRHSRRLGKATSEILKVKPAEWLKDIAQQQRTNPGDAELRQLMTEVSQNGPVPIEQSDSQTTATIGQPDSQTTATIGQPDSQTTATIGQPDSQATAPIPRSNSQATAPIPRPNSQATASIPRSNSQATAPIPRSNSQATAPIPRSHCPAIAPIPSSYFPTPAPIPLQYYQTPTIEQSDSQATAPIPPSHFRRPKHVNEEEVSLVD